MSNDNSDTAKSPYELLGGDVGVRSVVTEFYHLMDTLPEAASIRAMHKGDLTEMSEKLAVFLIGWMGGPQNYNERFGRIIIPTVHSRFDIGEGERDQWLLCMRGALGNSALGQDMITRLMKAFTQMADMCRTK